MCAHVRSVAVKPASATAGYRLATPVDMHMCPVKLLELTANPDGLRSASISDDMRAQPKLNCAHVDCGGDLNPFWFEISNDSRAGMSSVMTPIDTGRTVPPAPFLHL